MKLKQASAETRKFQGFQGCRGLPSALNTGVRWHPPLTAGEAAARPLLGALFCPGKFRPFTHFLYTASANRSLPHTPCPLIHLAAAGRPTGRLQAAVPPAPICGQPPLPITAASRHAVARCRCAASAASRRTLARRRCAALLHVPHPTGCGTAPPPRPPRPPAPPARPGAPPRPPPACVPPPRPPPRLPPLLLPPTAAAPPVAPQSPPPRAAAACRGGCASSARRPCGWPSRCGPPAGWVVGRGGMRW